MFFDNLKEACFKSGTSPTALLKSLGMSTSSVTAWKKGVTPSIGTVYRLAEKLGIDPAMLLDPVDTSGFTPYHDGSSNSMEEHHSVQKKASALNEDDYILAKQEKPPIINKRLSESDIKDGLFEAAFFEGSKDLSDKEKDALWEDAKSYIRFKMTEKKKADNGKGHGSL